MSNTLRPELESLPSRLLGLPVYNGYPVPWFVHWKDGVPEFPVIDADKVIEAWHGNKCFVCGDTLGKYRTFVSGPINGISRVSSEPPSHLGCARWSARNCPFLSKLYTPRNRTLQAQSFAPGTHIDRNPGVVLLWTSLSYGVVKTNDGVLFVLHDPVSIEWWAGGHPATKSDVATSVDDVWGSVLEMSADGNQAEATNDMLRRKLWLEDRYPSI